MRLINSIVWGAVIALAIALAIDTAYQDSALSPDRPVATGVTQKGPTYDRIDTPSP